MIKKFISVLLCLIMLTGCSLSVCAQAEGYDSFGAYEHVFIIGVDGAGAAFDKVDSPCFDSIFNDNALRYNAHTEYITVSAQNWGSILTGVSYDVHGLTNNICKRKERSSSNDNNSVFYYVREKYPDSELVSFNNWKAINKGIIENDIGVNKINGKYDAQVTQQIVDYLDAGNKPTLMFVQLDDADHAAHTYGGFSENYYRAVETADRYIGQIYNAIVANGLMENGLFIVVADHGETADGHGGTTAEESSAVVAVAGKSVNSLTLNENVRNRDVAAIALYALGIEKPEHMTAVVPDELFGDCRDKAFSTLALTAKDEAVCEYCGIIHKGFFEEILGFFHKIAVFFNTLFK